MTDGADDGSGEADMVGCVEGGGAVGCDVGGATEGGDAGLSNGTAESKLYTSPTLSSVSITLPDYR